MVESEAKLLIISPHISLSLMSIVAFTSFLIIYLSDSGLIKRFLTYRKSDSEIFEIPEQTLLNSVFVAIANKESNSLCCNRPSVFIG